jgi:hypothetical protein
LELFFTDTGGFLVDNLKSMYKIAGGVTGKPMDMLAICVSHKDACKAHLITPMDVVGYSKLTIKYLHALPLYTLYF